MPSWQPTPPRGGSKRTHGDGDVLVAYFSMEFGVDARLAIYSGGLGVLAGDHLKAASELGVPLVGVGLFYRGGYFVQGVSDEGRQTEKYESSFPRPSACTASRSTSRSTSAARWSRPRSGATTSARSRCTCSTSPGSPTRSTAATGAPHPPGDAARRRWGPRALHALGISPTVYHVNEGHSAFLTIERARLLVEQGGRPTGDALEQIRRSTVFTTHTPVPAGNEVFGDDLVLRYVGDLAERAGISHEQLLGARRSPGTDGFGLTPLALRLSAHANGVSELHGEVAREMWAGSGPTRETADRRDHERRPPRHLARARVDRRSSARPVSAPRPRPTGQLGRGAQARLRRALDARTRCSGSGSPTRPASTPTG